MNVKPVLPWMGDIISDPKMIQELIERRTRRTIKTLDRKNDSNESVDHFSSKEKKLVRELIKKLSALEQSVLYMRYWENRLALEISKLFGLSETQVLSLLEDSIKKLRKFYDLEMNETEKTNTQKHLTND